MTKADTASPALGALIKNRLNELSSTDGLKRTQRWLAGQMQIGEVALSNKLSGADIFTDTDKEKINKILGTSF